MFSLFYYNISVWLNNEIISSTINITVNYENVSIDVYPRTFNVISKFRIKLHFTLKCLWSSARVLYHSFSLRKGSLSLSITEKVEMKQTNVESRHNTRYINVLCLYICVHMVQGLATLKEANHGKVSHKGIDPHSSDHYNYSSIYRQPVCTPMQHVHIFMFHAVCTFRLQLYRQRGNRKIRSVLELVYWSTCVGI